MTATVAQVGQIYSDGVGQYYTGANTKRGMENTLRANPLDVKEQYERQIKDLQEARTEANCTR